MTPLHVTARVPGQIAIPNGTLALDSLLTWVVAQRLGLPPLLDANEAKRIEIPIAREPSDRFYLCSFGVFEMTEFDVRYINRKAPLEQYQAFGARGRVQITAGVEKSYRIPMEVGHLVDERVEWWCMGDEPAVRDLIADVLYLGKKRSVGLGKVASWTVEPCEIWEGFPVLRDGKPLRPLPLDYPGLSSPSTSCAVLDLPYWNHSTEQMLAVP